LHKSYFCNEMLRYCFHCE